MIKVPLTNDEVHMALAEYAEKKLKGQFLAIHSTLMRTNGQIHAEVTMEYKS